MKKTLIIFVTAFALVVSCKQKEVVGPTGANGTNGTNGTNGSDGNANVKTFLYTTKQSDWVLEGGKWKCTISNVSNITKAVVDSGLVSVYLVYTEASHVLPFSSVVTHPTTKIRDYITYSYEYKLNEIKISYVYLDGFIDTANFNLGNETFKIVTATSTK